MRSVKLTGSAARPASPAAPRPSVLRKPRRLTTPSPLIPTWTMFDSNGMAVPLTPGDEFSRVDECPVNVFKDFDALAHLGHVGGAGFHFLRVGLSRQDPKIEGVQGGPIVRRGRQDLAQHGPGPVRGPPRRMALPSPLPCAAADASPAVATAFLPFCGLLSPFSWAASDGLPPGPRFNAAVGTATRSSGNPTSSLRASTIWSARSRLGRFEANAVLPAAVVVARTLRW